MNNLDLQTKTLSDYLMVDKKEFDKRKILNPTFNKDVRLFIDPMLLKTSECVIFREVARSKYEKFFQNLSDRILIAKELKGKNKVKAKKNIIQDLKFGEQKGLGLGYSRFGTAGRGTGDKIAKMLYASAEELIIKGSKNIGIFSVLFLLEEGFGADYISDMTAHIIIHELATFSEKIAFDMKIATKTYTIEDRKYKLPKHPLYNTYLLFVPYDILSPLNKVLDVKDVLDRFCNVDVDNDSVRQRINQDIAKILQKNAEDKNSISKLKKEAGKYVRNDKIALETLGGFVNEDKKKSYDFSKDSLGVNILSNLAEIFQNFTLQLDQQQPPLKIVDNIIEGYVNFVENNNKILRDLEKQKESSWQNSFLLYCKKICDENNINISPEAETGLGPVDFMLSRGSRFKILIEMKLSSNPNYIKGLEKQLEVYKKCVTPVDKSYYIYIDVEKNIKKSDKRKQKLLDIKKEHNMDTEIIFVDGKVKLSASKL